MVKNLGVPYEPNLKPPFLVYGIPGLATSRKLINMNTKCASVTGVLLSSAIHSIIIDGLVFRSSSMLSHFKDYSDNGVEQ